MDLTTPRYERKEGPYRHFCNPPGWWRRWRDGVRPGAIWRCSCGERYEFRPERLTYPSLYQAGQEHAPWWHLFEMGPPPEPLPIPPVPNPIRTEVQGQHPGEIGTTWAG